MFRDASKFNADISGWGTSSVVTFVSSDVFYMTSTFHRIASTATAFSWLRSHSFILLLVHANIDYHFTLQDNMFWGATQFNQDVSGWSLTSATDLSTMFNEWRGESQEKLSRNEHSRNINLSSLH